MNEETFVPQPSMNNVVTQRLLTVLRKLVYHIFHGSNGIMKAKQDGSLDETSPKTDWDLQQSELELLFCGQSHFPERIWIMFVVIAAKRGIALMKGSPCCPPGAASFHEPLQRFRAYSSLNHPPMIYEGTIRSRVNAQPDPEPVLDVLAALRPELFEKSLQCQDPTNDNGFIQYTYNDVMPWVHCRCHCLETEETLM